MDRKEKIKELKRKNALSIICKYWNEKGISISIDDFLECQETIFIQDNIIKKLDEMDAQNKSLILENGSEKAIGFYKQEILKNIKNDDECVYFIKNSSKNGAVKLNGEVLKDNIDFVIDESELLNGSCCIFCCTKDLGKGICIWSGEYDDHIYVW